MIGALVIVGIAVAALYYFSDPNPDNIPPNKEKKE